MEFLASIFWFVVACIIGDWFDSFLVGFCAYLLLPFIVHLTGFVIAEWMDPPMYGPDNDYNLYQPRPGTDLIRLEDAEDAQFDDEPRYFDRERLYDEYDFYKDSRETRAPKESCPGLLEIGLMVLGIGWLMGGDDD
ncbi:MAG: hypothetical protein OEZ10_02760 [Gammaproteobacteria bacterium]|nr:hypothetical protein [Gammaproteobacteria bacterium]